MSVYACSDLHGMYDLFIRIKAFLKPDDVVYFLGDANDRGLDGFKLIQEIYNDEQFVYLKGNHEDMLVDCARAWNVSGIEPEDIHLFHPRSFRLVCNNGGQKTFFDWVQNGADMNIIAQLDQLPLYDIYTNKNGKKIFLSHAGCTLRKDSKDNDKLLIYDDLLWSREHFNDGWKDYCPDNYIVVHGHTPIPHLLEAVSDYDWKDSLAPYWYADNHKCDIDQRAFYTKGTILLDLDTFEYHVFELDNSTEPWGIFG